MNDNDMVPRSRIRAVEDELAAAEAKTAKVQVDAAKEIHRLLAHATELESNSIKDANHYLDLCNVVDRYRSALERIAAWADSSDTTPCEIIASRALNLK